MKLRSSDQLRIALRAAKDKNHATEMLVVAEAGAVQFPRDEFWLGEYAEQLHNVGRSSEAEEQLLKAHTIFVNSATRYWTEIQLGLVLRDVGRYGEAEHWFRRAVESAPTKTGPYVYLAGHYARTERFADACEVLRTGLTAQGDRDEVYLNLALNLRALGDFKGAIESLWRALEISPTYEVARETLDDISAALAFIEEGKGRTRTEIGPMPHQNEPPPS
jgi:Flp pilus assembly protein TadD